jgi:hypothetical protein
MADSAAGAADKSVQVKLVLLGTLFLSALDGAVVTSGGATTVPVPHYCTTKSDILLPFLC